MDMLKNKRRPKNCNLSNPQPICSPISRTSHASWTLVPSRGQPQARLSPRGGPRLSVSNIPMHPKDWPSPCQPFFKAGQDEEPNCNLTVPSRSGAAAGVRRR
ncbi:hypothetical protein BDV10DRAFT_39858 [Aspergillus recurvatus]